MIPERNLAEIVKAFYCIAHSENSCNCPNRLRVVDAAESLIRYSAFTFALCATS